MPPADYAYVVVVGGAVPGISMVTQIVVSLWQLWRLRPPPDARPVAWISVIMSYAYAIWSVILAAHLVHCVRQRPRSSRSPGNADKQCSDDALRPDRADFRA